MSNPFRKPSAAEANPFDEPSYEPNPFNDPAVTAHTTTGYNPPQVYQPEPVSAYTAPVPTNDNPFYRQPIDQNGVTPVVSEVQPVQAVPGPSGAAGPAAFPGSKSKADVAKEKELRAKEAELKKREAELKKRETEAGPVKDKKNWPPCFPMVHHDIAADIPSEHRAMVRMCFFTYLLLILCFVWNIASVSAALTMNAGSPGVGGWFLALAFMVIGIPGAYWLWYKRLYNAARRDRAVTYSIFFCMYMVHIAWCVYAFIAPPIILSGGKSLTGIFTLINVLGANTTIGIMYIVGCVLWGSEVLFSFWVLKMVYSRFRGSDGANRLRSEGMSAALQHASTRV
eukprot:jgi/Chlat1/7217/Chrsp57S06858